MLHKEDNSSISAKTFCLKIIYKGGEFIEKWKGLRRKNGSPKEIGPKKTKI
jgi:hypothetical protein